MTRENLTFKIWGAGSGSCPFEIMRRHPVIMRLLVPGMLCFTWTAQAQYYVKIATEIALTGYRGDDTNAAAKANPRTISVVCITGTNEWGTAEWRIEHDWLRNALNKWFFDGTNVYESLQVTSPMSQDAQRAMSQARGPAIVPFEIAGSNLTINIWTSTDGHPMGDQGVNIAWLAFCSGKYLKRPGRLVPLPVEMLRHTRDRFAYTDKTWTFEDELGLPRTIDLYLSRSLFVASEKEFDREYFFGDRYTAGIEKRAATLPEGERFFHYQVSESTNFMGWVFPTKFEFFQNGRKFEQNGDWCWRGVGAVKGIAVSARPDGLFNPAMQQSVVDYRLRDATASVDGIIYTWTNSFAAQTSDPFVQKVFEKYVARAKNPPKLPECPIGPADQSQPGPGRELKRQ